MAKKYFKVQSHETANLVFTQYVKAKDEDEAVDIARKGHWGPPEYDAGEVNEQVAEQIKKGDMEPNYPDNIGFDVCHKNYETGQIGWHDVHGNKFNVPTSRLQK